MSTRSTINSQKISIISLHGLDCATNVFSLLSNLTIFIVFFSISSLRFSMMGACVLSSVSMFWPSYLIALVTPYISSSCSSYFSIIFYCFSLSWLPLFPLVMLYSPSSPLTSGASSSGSSRSSSSPKLLEAAACSTFYFIVIWHDSLNSWIMRSLLAFSDLLKLPDMLDCWDVGF